MIFKEITKEEFDAFSINHPQAHILQSAAQASIYEDEGIEYKIYALMNENDEIEMAGLYNIYRSARIFKAAVCFFGPIGDFSDLETFKRYHEHLLPTLKKDGIYKVRLYPQIIAQERDIDGEIVDDGLNNLHYVEEIEALGYQHYGFNQGMEEKLARYLFVKDIKDIKTEEELMQSFPHKGTSYAIKRALADNVRVRELEYDELDILYHILKKIHIEKESEIVPLEQLEQIYRAHKPYDTAKFMVAEIDTQEYEENVLASIKEQEALIAEFDERIAAGNAGRKTANRKNEALAILNKDKERLELAQKYKKNADDQGRLPLAAGLFYKYGHEMSNYVGGNDDEYLELYGNYALHWEMLNRAIQDEDLTSYNFYVTLGEFCGHDGGIHRFKAGFGGEIIEYLGAFDLPVNKFLFKLYEIFKG